MVVLAADGKSPLVARTGVLCPSAHAAAGTSRGSAVALLPAKEQSMVVVAVVLGSVVGVLVLIGLAGLALPRRWRIERSEVIAAEPAAIFPLVNDFERGWKQWNPFVEAGMTIGYEGAREGVGAVSTWLRGREAGRMEIRESDPFEGVVYDCVLNNGFSMVGRIEFRSEHGGTRVTWSDEGEIANPFFRF